MPVLQRRDSEEGRRIGLAVGLSFGSLLILCLVYLACSQMFAPFRKKKRRCKDSSTEMGGVGFDCRNGHVHVHRHGKAKGRSKKSKHKRKKRNRDSSEDYVFVAHGANGSGVPGVDVPEIINAAGEGANTQIPAVVVQDVSGVQMFPTIGIQNSPVNTEPIFMVNEPTPIVLEKRKHRSKKRKGRDNGGFFVFFNKSEAKRRKKRGPRAVELQDYPSATTRSGRHQRAVVVQEPIYQEVVQGV
jgi:hypothetical protein